MFYSHVFVCIWLSAVPLSLFSPKRFFHAQVAAESAASGSSTSTAPPVTTTTDGTTTVKNPTPMGTTGAGKARSLRHSLENEVQLSNTDTLLPTPPVGTPQAMGGTGPGTSIKSKTPSSHVLGGQYVGLWRVIFS
jgi:hypothetical protein